MAGIYRTVQGDTWDFIAYKLFGSEAYMKQLAEANWPLLDILVFPSGILMHVPDISLEGEDGLPYWKNEEEEENDY